MRISNKIHSGTAIAAAVIMMITTILSVGTNVLTLISSAVLYEKTLLISSVSNLVISMITCILMVVVLLRRKKDTVGGVLFLLTAVPIVVTGVFGNIFSTFAYFSASFLDSGMLIRLVAVGLIRLIANVASAAFRVFVAMECFKPGNISGGKMKPFLVILPIAMIILTMFATIVQNLYTVGDYGFGGYLLSALLPAVFAAIFSAGYVVMGLAFSIPVYEQNPYEYAYTGQANYNFN